jgi:arylsulfatase A-like enzyme
VAETRPGQVPWYVSIRKGDYKYIRYLIKDELDELYHLKNDPDELQNEIFNPEYREIVSELRAELQNELIRTEAPFADSMPQTRSEKKLVHKKEFAQ